ncbi:lysine--tRNA ligase [Dactylosporangium vinaceum]|uniref:Lysine--tRNA ligase n=1 Tax=Dactylosporangium vinaceum TaxID=53362 RepID=A0ABV5MMJ6_9ACTN|nr:lysine--tRNA ligase [Dactylosporangium vinaceum]UAB93212.1 lysine--tRNA ligase [Dactylosporangium vinaceum]
MTHSIAEDWVARFADEVIEAAKDREEGKPIVCASGLSPSGPIHLGNLREVMTPHLVADEIRRRGHDVVHILSWDDFDRFRKVPAGIEGVDDSWAEHIGRPLTSVPPPPGSPYGSWGEHFKAAMAASLEELGVQYRGISQTEMYTSGAYVEQVLLAMRERNHIDGVLGKYRTKIAPEENDEDGEGATGYYPYRPYCSVCNRDTTTVTAYDDETTELTYTCSYGHGATVLLREHRHGKLVWKVDWPMRWAYEGVHFEPSGVDHSSPGSSYVVGTQLVAEVFGAKAPIGPMYAFVAIAGQAKMSSSRGGVPTPADALTVMEAPLLRWLYSRRRPNQAFKVAFDDEIQRMYDEWDTLGRKVADGTAAPADAAAYHRAIGTAAGPLPVTPRPLPYRMLASVADITVGDPAQMLRILTDIDPANPIVTLDEARPRLDCAVRWVTTYVPDESRTHVRAEPDAELLASLDDEQKASLVLLADRLDDQWSLEGLTSLVYGVPKIRLGLPMDTKPTPELKVAQREFFSLLYRLLVSRESGPRLPTLLLSLGADRVRTLVGA